MLYLCATPIGNLEDITMRVLRVLSEVACIYAEDTRHSGILLAHFDIKKPLVSCHEHNEKARAAEIVERVRNGEDIAYISDAGMPCISDPGSRLVAACIENDVPYTVLPGACACVTALALSGLDTSAFTFFGFLPRSGKERRSLIEAIVRSQHTSIIYESPNRISATLKDIMNSQDDASRRVALVREITKVYEQVSSGTFAELVTKYDEIPPKGECVIVIEGAKETMIEEGSIDASIVECLNSGVSAKETAKRVSECLNIPKNEVYKRVLELKEVLSDE